MTQRTDTKSSKVLDLPADRSLFETEVSGWVATCYQNERPLGGLAGLLDWRFQGAFSQGLRSGAFSGKEGECVYLPVSKNKKTYHVLFVGCGHSSHHGDRAELPEESWATLKKNLLSLRLPSIGLSRADFGNASVEDITKKLKGVSVWIAP